MRVAAQQPTHCRPCPRRRSAPTHAVFLAAAASPAAVWEVSLAGKDRWRRDAGDMVGRFLALRAVARASACPCRLGANSRRCSAAGVGFAAPQGEWFLEPVAARPGRYRIAAKV